MLQIFKNNNPFTVIILFIYALAINWQVLFNPVHPTVPEGDFLFHIIVGFLNVLLFNSAFAFTLLTVFMLVLQGLYLNAVTNSHKLYIRPGYLVAFTYVTLSSLYPLFGYFSQPLLVNWCIIMLIDVILRLSHAQKATKLIYNAGFVMGMAMLVMFPAIAYLLLLIIAIAMLRRFNPSEMVVAILGYATPVYFAACLLFLFDKLFWLPRWVHLGFNLPGTLPQPVYTIGMLVGIIVLFILGTYMLQKQLTRISIFIRRGWTVIAIGLFLSVVTALFTLKTITSAWLITIPVLSLVIANAYYSEKNKAFSNFAFYFTLLVVIFCKIATA